MSQRNKADGGKTKPVLMQSDCAGAMYLVQRVFDFGEQKYVRKSWQEVEQERWDNAQRRHQQALDLAEEKDIESGLPHRAHQIAGLIFLFSQELRELAAERKCSMKELVEDLGQFNDPPQDHKQDIPLPTEVLQRGKD